MKFRYTLILLVSAFVSCSTPIQRQNTSDTFTDDYGRRIAIPTNPKRVVSASPAITEIIFALGAEDLLVGRTDFCTYPPEASRIASIGGISNINIESILALHPDLVISGSMIPKQATELIEHMGVPFACVIEKKNFDGLYTNIAHVGHLLGRTHAADSLIALLKGQEPPIDTLSDKGRPTVYYVVGFGPGGNFTAGGNTFINDIIRMAGGRNIAENLTGWNYSIEALTSADPDFILIRKEDAETFSATKPYSTLSAVKNGRVIAIESGLIDLQVPRNIEAVSLIRERLQSL